MQKVLYGLIELQELDNRLDELMDERGDLPLIVDDLTNKLDEKKHNLDEYNTQLKDSKLRVRELELQIADSKEKLEKYEEQLYQVKTNKEYDAITAETDTAKAQLERDETELLEITKNIEDLNEKITELEEEIEKLEAELEENSVELKAKLAATAEEENLLKQEREIILSKANPEIIKTYEMVRKARSGQGIARIENGTCGGCYSYIPPQKVVEIKKMEKIYTCEFCGRILVWYESEE
ncbi:MAG TPA: hypothetical protein EYP36_12150 [Calditrichaeota bacterium]|nr:hypothetical protein [Calditrichota bacterium]